MKNILKNAFSAFKRRKNRGGGTEMPVFFASAEGGTTLPELTNPATAAQIMAGYQAIAADGSVIDGAGAAVIVGGFTY